MKKMKILAVDDEESVLNVIKNTFPGHTIIAETSSLKATEILKKEKFDIFIIDYQIPDINGIELLGKIREVYKGRQYVGILCTAYGTIHLFKEELVQGLFSFFIEKPFDIAALKETVNKAIIKLGKMQSSAEQQADSSET